MAILIGSTQDFQNAAKIINLPTPSADGDAVNKSYVDTISDTSFTTTIGNGIANTFNVQHDLNSENVAVTVRQTAAPKAFVLVGWSIVDENNISVNFDSSVIPTATQYTVTVQK